MCLLLYFQRELETVFYFTAALRDLDFLDFLDLLDLLDLFVLLSPSLFNLCSTNEVKKRGAA